MSPRRRVETLSLDILGDPRPAGSAHDPEADALSVSLASMLHLGAVTSPRSLQRAVGWSEIGTPCERQLSYRVNGVRPVNVRDPLRALVGTGVHAAVAEVFRRLDNGSGRFEVERPVNYRGVPGTVDLFDRSRATAVDWKTTSRRKLANIRRNGPRTEHVTQLQGYGAGLDADGEAVSWVALAYLVVDPDEGTLDDLWVWRTRYDRAVADAACERLVGIRHIDHPSTVAATPGPLCPWCPFYRAQVPASDVSCPGHINGG